MKKLRVTHQEDEQLIPLPRYDLLLTHQVCEVMLLWAGFKWKKYHFRVLILEVEQPGEEFCVRENHVSPIDRFLEHSTSNNPVRS